MESQFFTTLDGRPLDWVLFLDHKLGKLYQAIPFDEIASILPYKKPKTGPVFWFEVKGGIGLRMKKTTCKHRYLFKRKCTFFGGDQIYANNKNRKYCARENISTCFQPKGRPPVDKTVRKQQSQLRSLIGRTSVRIA